MKFLPPLISSWTRLGMLSGSVCYLLSSCSIIPEPATPATPKVTATQNDTGPMTVNLPNVPISGGGDDGGYTGGTISIPGGDGGYSGGYDSPADYPTTGEGTGYSGGSTSPSTTAAGKFVMTIEDQQKYKKFTNLVTGLKSFVTSDQKVMNALIKYTGLSKEKILEHLTSGKGPMISITNIPKGYGSYNGSTNPSTIFIDAGYVNNLEAVSPYNTGVYQALNLLLAVTVLHEYVHYGDYTTGTNFQGEEGNAFELGGFGVIVTIANGFSVSLDRLNP